MRTSIIRKLLLMLSVLTLFHAQILSQVFVVDSSSNIKGLVLNKFIDHNNSGIFIENIKYTGQKGTIGSFIYKSDFKSLPPEGLILSTGQVRNAACVSNESISSENNYPGDPDLEKIAKAETFDASVLEFYFISLTDSISFTFQFASTEYPEYVDYGVSDIFAFLVEDTTIHSKVNIAVLPDSDIPITIDLINDHVNPEYYINNTPERYNPSKLVSMRYMENRHLLCFDGFTKQIHTGLKLKPYYPYKFKIAIADVGDQRFDSWILLKANSFASKGKYKNPTQKEISCFLEFNNQETIHVDSLNNKIKLTSPVYFDYNSSEIRKESFEILEKVLAIARNSVYQMDILGFADTKGTCEYNLKLSQQRADAIKKYLIEQGIDEKRLNAVGKGEMDINDNMNEARKVEFILY